MKNKLNRRHNKSLKRRLKRMAAAAAVAGAALVSSALLPGMPATAHASALPDTAMKPDTAVQQMVKSPKGIYNMQSDSKIPLKKAARIQAKAAAQPSRQVAQQSQQAPKQAEAGAQAVKANVNKKAPAAATADKTAAPDKGNSEEVINVKATAYAPGEHDNGQWGDKTHLGTTVRPGVIAVDPKVIPLGTQVYLEYPDGTGHYAVAEDTGGAIKGNRIDIAMNSVDKAYDFGIKNVKVYVNRKA
ncbi:3D domain-containing protein [Sporomusa aerivorans]|uniref:3D domain-containing protein n=1 Tax=Sporomusa aerivorans TaxID=204936 RepID=UPI00352B6D64